MKYAVLPLLTFILASGCASKGVDADRATADATLHDWSHVEKLAVGTPVRVTEKDADRAYGRIMVVTDLRLTLELEAGSETIERSDIALIERFPTSFPKSIPNAAVGVGAALSLSSSSSPKTYSRSVAPSQETLDPQGEHTRNGYYVDALSLVGTTAEMVKKAIESSRTTVVVYRAR
ncbi:MAG: hypothetical protein ACRD3V_13760 [Vicinamibacteria bacterium]